MSQEKSSHFKKIELSKIESTFGLFHSLSDFSVPYLGNLWLVRLGILHCSLWPTQTIYFLDMGGGGFERTQQ